jgi:MBG domain (YGX type)/YDG domain
VLLNAASGIGSSTTAIQTTTSNLALSNSVTGGIYVTNTGTMTVAANSVNGDVVIKTSDGISGGRLGEASAGNINVGTVNGLVGVTATGTDLNQGSFSLMAGSGAVPIGSKGGYGGEITVNARVLATQSATLIGGNGGTGADGTSSGGTGGDGGLVMLNAPVSVGQSLVLTSGSGGVGGRDLSGSGGGGHGGFGGELVLNAPTSAGQATTLKVGIGGIGMDGGGQPSSPSITGNSINVTTGSSLNVNGAITPASGDVNLTAGSIGTSAAGVINAGTGSVNITQTGTNTLTLGNITATNLTVDSAGFAATVAADASKRYDGTTSISNATVGPVTGLAFTSGSNLSSAAPTTASFDDKNAGTGKTVTATGFTITGYNGTATSVLKKSSAALTATTTADISQAPLTVTANNDTKVEGTPYVGGKGVSITGFVYGEGANELSGTLAFGGNSQGASAAGKYDITPIGLTSNNYNLSFASGQLSLTPAPVIAVVTPKVESTPAPTIVPTPQPLAVQAATQAAVQIKDVGMVKDVSLGTAPSIKRNPEPITIPSCAINAERAASVEQCGGVSR